jgi:hypothetical protein
VNPAGRRVALVWSTLWPTLMLGFASVAEARTTPIDDSGSLPQDAPLVLRWQQLSPRPPVDNRMIGTLTLHLKLNVAPWLARSGRIYLVLPEQQPGGLNVSWTTHGYLLPGHVVSGSRALAYSGRIRSPFIEDVIELTVQVDGTRMRQLYHLNFRFEMDES